MKAALMMSVLLLSPLVWSQSVYCDKGGVSSSHQFEIGKGQEPSKLTVLHRNLIQVPVMFDFTLADSNAAVKAGGAVVNMGEKFTVSFEPSECKTTWGLNKSIRCYHTTPATIGGQDVDGYEFLFFQEDTTLSLTVDADTPKEEMPVISEKVARFSFTIEGKKYLTYMKYSSNECGKVGASNGDTVEVGPVGEAL